MSKIQMTKSDARGGTELMRDRIDAGLSPANRDRFEIIHSRVDGITLDPSKKTVLVLHDTANDTMYDWMADPQARKRLGGIVCVSHVQRDMFHYFRGVPYSEMVVIPNAIEPFGFGASKPKPSPVRLVYHSTPHRGLAILIPVFKAMAERFDITLDVASSFSVYGKEWAHRDQEYKALFDECKTHPKITYHGRLPNGEVRELLKTTHIHAYPCTWFETYCLSMVEAMASGNLVVTSDLGALPEVGANWPIMYGFTENMQEHANRFAANLAFAIDMVKGQSEEYQAHVALQGDYINNFHNITRRMILWNNYLDTLART